MGKQESYTNFTTKSLTGFHNISTTTITTMLKVIYTSTLSQNPFQAPMIPSSPFLPSLRQKHLHTKTPPYKP